jgi:hypothetical protein
MTLITGQIKNSAGLELPCAIEFTLDDPMIKGANLYLPTTHKFTLSSGLLDGANIEVPSSELEAVTYKVRITSPTGSIVYDEFHALVPNVASINITDLVPTGIVDSQLPATIRRLALYIGNDPNLSDLLSPITLRGQWSSTATYDQYDVVYHDGASYIAKAGSPTQAPLPVSPLVENDRWVMLVEGSKGDKGDRGDDGTDGIDGRDGANASLIGLTNIKNPSNEDILVSSVPILVTGGIAIFGPSAPAGDRSGNLSTTNFVGNAFDRYRLNSCFKRPTSGSGPIATGIGTNGNGNIIDPFLNSADMPAGLVPKLAFGANDDKYFLWNHPDDILAIASFNVTGTWSGSIADFPTVVASLIARAPTTKEFFRGPRITAYQSGSTVKITDTVSWIVRLSFMDYFYIGAKVSDYVGAVGSSGQLDLRFDNFSLAGIGGYLSEDY